MSNIVVPVGSSLPASGDTMNAAAWHALIDGLQVENFGADDFLNGSARITSVESTPPTWAPGRPWWDGANDRGYVWGESGGASNPAQMVGTTWEIVCWADSPVSLGMPVYVEGRVWRNGPNGPNTPIPKVSAAPFEEGTTWAPACGLAQDSTTGSEYIRVGFAGLMEAMCDDTSVSYASLGFFENTEGDRLTAGGHQDYATDGQPGVKFGVFIEESYQGSSSLRPLDFFKQISCWLEDRT